MMHIKTFSWSLLSSAKQMGERKGRYWHPSVYHFLDLNSDNHPEVKMKKVDFIERVQSNILRHDIKITVQHRKKTYQAQKLILHIIF